MTNPAQQVLNLRAVLLDIQQVLGIPNIPKEDIDTKTLKKDVLNAKEQLLMGIGTLPEELLYDLFMDINLVHNLISHLETSATDELKRRCYAEPNKDSKLKRDILKTIGLMERTHGKKVWIK